jgi:hypothetical protein
MTKNVDRITNCRFVAFTGLKGSGKDSAADWLIETRDFEKRSLAIPIKNCMKSIFHFTDFQLNDVDMKEQLDPAWGFSPREAMQKFGTELMRNELAKYLPIEQGEIWRKSFKIWFQRKLRENPDIRIVVPDLRFPDEYEFLKDLGFLVVKIRRNGLENNSTHSSEAFISKMPCDIEIINEGKDLEKYKKSVENHLARHIVPVSFWKRMVFTIAQFFYDSEDY